MMKSLIEFFYCALFLRYCKLFDRRSHLTSNKLKLLTYFATKYMQGLNYAPIEHGRMCSLIRFPLLAKNWRILAIQSSLDRDNDK